MVADKRVWESISNYQTTNGWQSAGAKIEVGGTEIWYPLQGSIGSNGYLNQAESRVRLWSSVVDINNTKYPFELRYNSSGNATTSPSPNRNVALPVRCISGHSTESITNLSAAQTANCYMVHRPGYYKFKANVRGNGVTQLLTTNSGQVQDIADGMSENFTPAKVDFLWYQGDFSNGWTNNSTTPNESEIPMILMNGGKLDESGYVTFYVGEFHKGNVGLAAYDVVGDIIWSWHIWFTDKPEDKQSGDYSLMDRFLGATYAPTISGNNINFANNNQLLATYGFYYQWGKKDPFFGPRTVNAGNQDNTNCSTYWRKAYNGGWSVHTNLDSDGIVRVSEAPATPLTFRKRSDPNAEQGAGSIWFTEDFLSNSQNQNAWGYVNTGTAVGQGYTKTVHDPCPPGYRTPFHHAWGYGNNQGYTYGENGGNINLGNGEQNFDSYGLVFNKANFDRSWYPFMGYRHPQDGGYEDVGQQGRLVTGMPMGQYNTRSYIYTNTYTGQVANSGSNGCGPAYGMSARCQKE
jgi:hypothetical protein